MKTASLFPIEQLNNSLLKSPLLGPLYEILTTCDFEPAPTKPIGPDEQRKGWLTDVEIAAYTLAVQNADSHNKMIMKLCDGHDQGKVKISIQELKKLKNFEELYYFYDNFLWVEINLRIGKPKNGFVFDVRADYEIVELKKSIPNPSTKGPTIFLLPKPD
ncbi:MAG: hypothetical protein WCF93_03665 [Candidatus Moraniibacteriota bacterium]